MAFFDAYKSFKFPNDEAIWQSLTVDSAVFLRVYCDYCYAKNVPGSLLTPFLLKITIDG